MDFDTGNLHRPTTMGDTSESSEAEAAHAPRAADAMPLSDLPTWSLTTNTRSEIRAKQDSPGTFKMNAHTNAWRRRRRRRGRRRRRRFNVGRVRVRVLEIN